MAPQLKTVTLLLAALASAEASETEDQQSASTGFPSSWYPTPKHLTRKQIVSGAVELFSEEEEPHFLVPKHLEPGQLAPIVWRDDGGRVDSETFAIGLPPKLTEVIDEYLTKAGIYELSKKILYEDPVAPRENRLYHLNDGSEWGAMGPSWKTGDLTWIDAANEEGYELTLDLLRRGDFDIVLDTLGKKFKMDGMMVQGVGVLVVSHFTGSNMHFDIGDTGHKFFNIIFPIDLPKSGPAQLNLSGRRDSDYYPTSLRKNTGILLGGQSKHGTGACDYREAGEFRTGIAIYLADLNEDNIELIASDGTSLFPNDEDVPWFRAQAGRVWGHGNSLKADKGRKPYGVSDDPKLDCPALAKEGKCETDLEGIRLRCNKSCKVYMEDDVYYEHLAGLVGTPAKTEL